MPACTCIHGYTRKAEHISLPELQLQYPLPGQFKRVCEPICAAAFGACGPHAQRTALASCPHASGSVGAEAAAACVACAAAAAAAAAAGAHAHSTGGAGCGGVPCHQAHTCPSGCCLRQRPPSAQGSCCCGWAAVAPAAGSAAGPGRQLCKDLAVADPIPAWRARCLELGQGLVEGTQRVKGEVRSVQK